jgi:RimJ/RimL family protein N-acetyltransferase
VEALNTPRAVIGSLKDGRPVRFDHVHERDAGASLEYVEEVSGETDFLSFGPGEFGKSVEEQAAYFKSLGDHELGLMVKAEVGGQIAGMAGIRRSPRPRIRHVGELGISVRQPYWGTGLGKSLCQYVLREAQHIGVTKVELRVRQDNARAIRLYESVGFVVEGKPRAAFLVGGKYYDEFTMGIVLDSASS